MKTYKIKGGEIIQAKSNVELIEKIRKGSFNPGNNIYDFIKETSKACKLQTGAVILIDDIDVFVESLIGNKFIKELSND